MSLHSAHGFDATPQQLTWYFIKILPFSQCIQKTKQFVLVDSPFWAKQNGTDDFVVACTVVKVVKNK